MQGVLLAFTGFLLLYFLCKIAIILNVDRPVGSFWNAVYALWLVVVCCLRTAVFVDSNLWFYLRRFTHWTIGGQLAVWE